MSQPLATERILLREVTEDDAIPMFHLIHHNPNVLKTFLAQYVENIEDATAQNLIRYQEAGNLIYILELKQTKEVIGLLLEQGHTVDSIEIGYALGEAYWNQGYMTEAVQGVIQHLFHLQYQRVTAECFVENIASYKVMEKCGMKRTDQSYTLKYQGKDHTVIEYEIYSKTGI